MVTGEARDHRLRLAALAAAFAREERELAALPIVFRLVASNHWEIGDAPHLARVVPAVSAGVAAAHQVLATQTPVQTDLADPRRAVAVTAATWAEQHGCLRLAAVMRRIGVRDGQLVYLPGRHPPPMLLS